MSEKQEQQPGPEKEPSKKPAKMRTPKVSIRATGGYQPPPEPKE